MEGRLAMDKREKITHLALVDKASRLRCPRCKAADVLVPVRIAGQEQIVCMACKHVVKYQRRAS
jgi:Zn ribbon nucleic-acid-binding protein